MSAEEAGYSLALKKDGTVVSIGYQYQLVGRAIDRPPPAGLSNVVAVAPGLYHALALKSDGTVVGWGTYDHGQITPPPGLAGVVAIAAADNYSLALKADGKVVGWGGMYSRYVTNVPLGLSNVVSIAAGFNHGMALKADGTVALWGNAPEDVPAGLSNVVAIATDGAYHLALKADGTVVSWGGTWYYYGMVPPSVTNATAISAGQNALALVGDGPPFLTSPLINLAAPNGTPVWLRITATGSWPLSYQWAFNGKDLTGETNAILGLTDLQFAQSGSYSVRVSNALGTATASSSISVMPFVITIQPQSQLAYGATTVNFNVEANGLSPQYQWQFNGMNLPGATNKSLTLTNIQSYQAGIYRVVISNSYGVVISSDAGLEVSPLAIISQPQSQSSYFGGTATFSVAALGFPTVTYQWQFHGTNLPGATKSALTLTNLQFAQAGQYSALVSNPVTLVKSTNVTLGVSHVIPWGGNFLGQLNLPHSLSNITQIACGIYYSLALRTNGTVVAWGWGGYGNLDVPPGLSNVIAIAGGDNHSLALKADGSVAVWGSVCVADAPEDLTNAVSIALRWRQNLALRADGSVLGWDHAFCYARRDPPAGVSNIVGIATVADSLLLRPDGTVLEWTYYDNELKAVSNLTGVVSIAMGDSFSLALKADGTVVAWGDNSQGQTNVPIGLTNIVAIRTGTSHSLALRADGTVVAWGATNDGRCAVPSFVSNAVAIAAASEHSLAMVGEGPPFIAAQPISRLADVASTNYFRIEATGDFPLSYQWQFNGTNLPGSTKGVLVLENLHYDQAGMYSVLVSNRFGATTSLPARLRINRAPVADASATPPFYVSCNGTGANVILDGSRSSDPDHDPLYYSWGELNGTHSLATGVVSMATLSTGTHEIFLTVYDGVAYSTNSVTVTILTVSQAVERLISIVETNAHSSPMLATLKATFASISRGDMLPANNQLASFQNQLSAQVSSNSSELAERLRLAAQQVRLALDCMTGSTKSSPKLKGIIAGLDGRARVIFAGNSGVVYLVEASTNLVDWEIIGVTTAQDDGIMEFDDRESTKHPNRFYRLRE